MTAKQLIDIHGPALIGQKVDTEAIGEYPGGIATVTELAPDPQCEAQLKEFIRAQVRRLPSKGKTIV